MEIKSEAHGIQFIVLASVLPMNFPSYCLAIVCLICNELQRYIVVVL